MKEKQNTGLQAVANRFEIESPSIANQINGQSETGI
jgi:hypothetical protein